MSWLFDLILPVTLLTSMMLFGHKTLLNWLGATNTYLCWLIVPCGLLAYLLPMPWFESVVLIESPVERFLVSPSTEMSAHSQQYWWQVWAVGFATILLYGVVSFLGANKRILRESKPVSLPDNIRGIYGAKNIECRTSCQVSSALLIGLFKQVLVLPSDFHLLYSKEQQQLIIEHELTHFQRNDIFWNLVAALLVAIFWFHPLAWLAYFRFRQDQELSCDALVLARKPMHCKVSYSKALLVTAATTPPLAFAQLSFKKYGDKAMMFERLEQIKQGAHASKKGLIGASVIAMALVSTIGVAGSLSENKASTAINVDKAYEAQPIVRIEPKYPLEAAKNNVEGAVLLQFDLTEAGNVKNIRVVKAIPENTFDKVSKTALAQWKYQTQGKAYRDQLVQLDYRLDQDSSFKDVSLVEKIKVTN